MLMPKKSSRQSKNVQFQQAVWDGDLNPNSKLKLAVALGMHPDRLERFMGMPGCPQYRGGKGVGGFSLVEFRDFIARMGA